MSTKTPAAPKATAAAADKADTTNSGASPAGSGSETGAAGQDSTQAGSANAPLGEGTTGAVDQAAAMSSATVAAPPAMTRAHVEKALAGLPGDNTNPDYVVNAMRSFFGGLFTAEDEATVRSKVRTAAELNLPEGHVLVHVPRAYRLMLDSGIQVPYAAGTPHMPREHALHWYSKDNGVTLA